MSTLRIELLVKPEGSKYLIWIDITQFVEQGLTIADVADGTFDSGKFTVDFTPGDVNFDVTEAIPPRTPVKISEYEPGILEPQIQFILQTADSTSVPLRFEQTDDKGEVTAFYTHTVNLIELTKETEGKFPPNLAITQPKHIFAEAYKRDVSFRFALPTRNKSLKLLEAFEPFDNPLNVDVTRNLNNNTGVIGYDDTKLVFETKYDNGVPIAGPAMEGYSITISLKMSSTAPQLVKTPRLGIGFLEDIRRIYISRSGTLKGVLPLDVKVKTTYYDINSVVIDYKERLAKVEYYGDDIIREMIEHGPPPIIGTGDSNFVGLGTSSIVHNIIKNASADKVEVEFEWKPDLDTTGGENRQLYADKFGPGHSQQIDKSITYEGGTALPPFHTKNVIPVFTFIGGFPSPIYTYYWPEVSFYSLDVNILSSVITEAQTDTYITALDIVQKALNEINLRRSREYRLSRRFKQLLSEEVSPEMTLEGYSLKEVLYKYGRIVNVVPVLGDPDLLDPDEDVLTTISYIKPGENVYDFSISDKEFIEVSNEVVLADFYSTIASRLHNVVSEHDYHTEKVAVQADTEGFTQLTEANMAFLPSIPIYWLRQIKIKGLQIPMTYKVNGNSNVSGVILGNNIDYAFDSPSQSWDFTERCLEEDIWEALPNVNYATPEGREMGFLSRGNTISYKSGTRSIRHLGDRAPNVPTYHPPFTIAAEIANLAIVETAAVLAIQTWSAYLEELDIGAEINLGVSDLKYLEAEVTYTPLDEFMYRHTLDDPKRRHIDIEHRVNAQDKVLSLRDTAEMMIMEQNKKGHNQVVSQTLIHTSIASCYKTGWKTKNGYVITSRVITKFNEYVQCAYTLAKNFVVQSDHVGLDVKYERYAIPYEHIMREILNYTHIMISQKVSDLDNYALHIGTDATTKYLAMVLGWEEAPKQIFGLAELTYSQEIQTDREAIFKLHKLTDQRVLMYIGKWVDNYSAGNQIVEAPTGMYNQPYRYSDSNGKVQTIRYEVFKNMDFDIRKYPYDPDVLPFNRLLGSDTQQSFESGDLKDAREAYEFNITGSIEDASDDEILIFSTKGVITHLAILANDAESLSYATKFTELSFKTIIEGGLVLETPLGESGVRTFRVKMPAYYFDGYTNEAIALYYGAGQTEPVLKYIFKEPHLHREGSDIVLEFYAIPTRGGYEYNDMYVSDRYIGVLADSIGVGAEINAYKLTDNAVTLINSIGVGADIDITNMEYPVVSLIAGILIAAEIDINYFEYPKVNIVGSIGIGATISYETYEKTQHTVSLSGSIGIGADISITKTEDVTQLVKPIISVSHEGSSTIIVNVYNPNPVAAYIYHSTGSGYTKVTPSLAAYGSRSLTITRPYGTSAFYLYVNLSDATGYYDSADASVYVSAYVATYTVTFKDWNNNTLKTQTVSQGGDATPPAQPSVGDCYFWAGWSGNYTNVQKNETVVATRVIKQFTVTFKRAWDGTTIGTPQIVNCGSSAAFPTSAQIGYGAGYEYDYYSGNYQNVTKNETVTIYRKASVVLYTITWRYESGVIAQQDVLEYGQYSYAPQNNSPGGAGYYYDWPYQSVLVTGNRTIYEEQYPY